MRFIDLQPDDIARATAAASLLVECFRDHAPGAWPTMDAALEEVRASLTSGRISRVAIDERGEVLGWIAGAPMYDGRVWELHPLVVRPDSQSQGIGTALVADLEERVRERGGATLWLGTDDEDGRTSLAGVDLYPNVFDHLTRIRNLKRHPYEFYQKQGFVIVGVVPDANGFGKPDILMARRIG